MNPLVWKEGDEVLIGNYYIGMPDNVYHKTSGFISKSSLAQLGKETPFRFFNSKQRDQTPAMKMGTALHCAILEPEKFEASYLLMPDVRVKTLKAYKDAVKENPEMEILNGSDAKNLQGMINAVMGNDAARELLELDGWNEISGFHTDAESGVNLRHRFDKLSKCGVGVDLKKTQSVHIDDIAKTINDYRYDMQDSLYSDAYKEITGLEIKAFYFIFVEEKYPHQVAVVYLDDVSKQVGRDRYKELIVDYCFYVDNKKAINNNSQISMISLPEYVLRQYENELEDGGIY